MNNTKIVKLEVPYYSQFIDIQDSFWMLRACGGVSLKMIAEFLGADVPDIVTLCEEAKERGGYDMQNGWVHDYLVMKAKELGLEAYRKEGLTSTEEIVFHLDKGFPVIVSVEKRVLEQKRFHMLVLVGYERSEAGDITFSYHEPESTDEDKGKFRKCDEETFLSYWRGKALFISAKK